MRARSGFLRQTVATGLCALCAGPLGWAQQAAIAPEKPTGSVFIRPYKTPYVPPIRRGNTTRLQDLVRAGKLYLTVQDAIALALENNIDLESDRYNPLIDQWNLERSQAGGALPGVPSGVSQAGSVASGQGVSGSQAAAGVSTTGGGNQGTSNAVNASITQIGPVTPTLDPVFQDTQSYAHKSQPQPNVILSVATNLVQNTRNYTETLSQGILTGGTATLTYRDSYLNENAPTDVLNPSTGTSFAFSLQHNLLAGFGTAVNGRTITVARATLKIDELNFRTEVIATVVNVLNLYYGLVADYEDLKAKQTAVEVARTFYENNKKQVQIGTMAPLDVTTAEAQVASTEQDLVVSQTTLEQQELQLKNVLSRNGLADPLIANVQIIPLDRINIPQNDTLPPIKDLVATAFANRTDIQAEKLGLVNLQTSALGTENGVLPQLVGLVSATDQGLAGVPRAVALRSSRQAQGGSSVTPPGIEACPPGVVSPTGLCEIANSSVVGGIGTALGQTFRRDYPTERAGAYFSPTLRNRQATADNAIDQLSLRQSALETQRDVNQVAVDVANQVTALRQARARYQSAVRNRILEQQLLDAEQKKFALGASTTYNVVQQQRDLVTAQSAEVAALVAFSNAQVALNQTLGTTLKDSNVSLDEAVKAKVDRPSTLPATLPATPVR